MLKKPIMCRRVSVITDFRVKSVWLIIAETGLDKIDFLISFQKTKTNIDTPLALGHMGK